MAVRALPPLRSWIGLWCGASLTCHVIRSDVCCPGLLAEEGGWATATGQTRTSRTQISRRRMEKGAGGGGHPGELIRFVLVSSASTGFSCNQETTCLQGKGDERLVAAVAASWAARGEGCETQAPLST